jgi:hypothetical protein
MSLSTFLGVEVFVKDFLEFATKDFIIIKFKFNWSQGWLLAGENFLKDEKSFCRQVAEDLA